MTERNPFIYPHSRYYGQVKPENLVFNANLQEFASPSTLYRRFAGREELVTAVLED